MVSDAISDVQENAECDSVVVGYPAAKNGNDFEMINDDKDNSQLLEEFTYSQETTQ